MNVNVTPWHKKAGELLSSQLNNEYIAYITYRAASAYFNSPSIEMPGLARKFYKMAKEELDHANGIVEFMNARGLKITFKEIPGITTEFDSVESVFEKVIKFEEDVSAKINSIYGEASDNNDFGMNQFLDPYLNEQVESIKELNCMYVNYKRCKDNVGTFIYDQSFLKKEKD